MRARITATLCCIGVLTLSTGAARALPHQAAAPTRTPQTYVAPTQSGQTVRMHVGDKLRVHLGSSFRRPTSSDRTVIHRISYSGGYPTSEDARATFKALSTGRASLSSETDAQCLHTTPHCEIAQQAWFVRIIVK